MAQPEIELILLRQLASYLTLPVFICDDAGNLLFYNEPAETLLGRRYDEVREMRFDALSMIFETRDADGKPLATEDLPLTTALRERHPAHSHLRIRGLDGVWHSIEVTAIPIEGQGKRHLGAFAIFWESHA